MLNQQEFLEKYNIKENDFLETGLGWDDLVKLYEDYLVFKDELEPTAIMLFNKLMQSKKVHSVRYRIKDPEHLIEKIIRKKIENKESNITIENYKDDVTDLIGLRALHLFKEDWIFVHEFISNTWDLKQTPVANYRKGDGDQITDFFKENGCEPKEHKFGYRSIHYIIKTQPGKQIHYGEIQVRTIFEEAWAEIDHTIRYPYDQDNPIFFQFLLILNRLSGSADEMGSFIQFLKEELKVKEKEFHTLKEEKEELISDLEDKIGKLNLQDKELEEVKADLKRLREQNKKSYMVSDGLISTSGTPITLGSALQDYGRRIAETLAVPIAGTNNIYSAVAAAVDPFDIGGISLPNAAAYIYQSKKEDKNEHEK